MEDDEVGPMSWDEARDLARLGGAIGARSLRHGGCLEQACLERITAPRSN
jgi:hypothetical protein